MNRVRGCLFIIVILLIIYMLTTFGGKSNQDILPTLAVLERPTETSRPDVRPTDTISAVTIIPTVVNRGFITITPAPGTVYPTATITDTPLPTVTDTAAPTQPVIQLTPIDLQIYYTKSTVNLRSCPSTSCSIVEKIPGGSPLGVSGIAIGEEVDAGNGFWYKVEHSYSEEYGYSKFFSYAPPVQNVPPTAIPQQPVVIPNQPTAAPSGTIICSDGYVWPGTTRQGACHGHGGIMK